MELTKQSVETILKEQSGPRVVICCEDHQFFPGSELTLPMKAGCKYCVFAQLYYDFSQVPPEKRLERLDQLERMVHNMAQEVEAGTFDVNILKKPIVTFGDE